MLVTPGIWIGSLVAGPDAAGIGPNHLLAKIAGKLEKLAVALIDLNEPAVLDRRNAHRRRIGLKGFRKARFALAQRRFRALLIGDVLDDGDEGIDGARPVPPGGASKFPSAAATAARTARQRG